MITLTQASVLAALGSDAVPEDFECAMKSWDLAEEWPCLSIHPDALVDSERWLIRRKAAALDVPFQLNVYTCNSFEGVWPTGTAAVVVAPNEQEAERMLREHLASIGLPQRDNVQIELLLVPQDVPLVRILCDGDY